LRRTPHVILSPEPQWHALYGSSLGLTTTGAQFLHQDTPGIADNVEDDDHFGAAVY
jgi:hypothetical protein